MDVFPAYINNSVSQLSEIKWTYELQIYEYMKINMWTSVSVRDEFWESMFLVILLLLFIFV